MKNRLIRNMALCLLVLLVVAGCRSTQDAIIPVTGQEVVPIPAQVETVRGGVLEYVTASAWFEESPPATGWQLDTAGRKEGQYRFLNDDWLMVIRLPNSRDVNEHIFLYNTVTHASWCGEVNPAGEIADTSYMP